MENLLIEYFKFNGKEKKDIKLIDELNPNKILKKYIKIFVDTNLYKRKIEIIDKEINEKIFNINYDIYTSLIENEKLGNYLNSQFYNIIIIEFINKAMKYKYPILPKNNIIIYNIYKDLKDESNLFKLDYGVFTYDLIIKNKFTKILELGFGNGYSGIFICAALKNLELYDFKTKYTVIDPDQKNKWKNIGKTYIENLEYTNMKLIEGSYNLELPELYKNIKLNDKLDMIYINGIYTFDYIMYLYYSNLILKDGGLLVLYANNNKQLKEFDNYVNSNYTHFEKITYNLSSLLVYKKLKN
jgi:hypothetical protein